MFRRLVFLPLLLVSLASVGCCTCSPRMYGGGCGPCGGGCGQRYVHEFISDPPACGDPCNSCGGFNGGCGGGCARPLCFMNLWAGIIGRRCDCGSCGGGSCGGCGGSGCSSCGGGSVGGYSSGYGYADGGIVDGGQYVQQGPMQGPQMADRPVQQQRSVMTPRPTQQTAPRTAPPSPTARNPVQGKTTGLPRNQMQRTGNVRLMSYEDEPAEPTAKPASASAQTISHRANFVR